MDTEQRLFDKLDSIEHRLTDLCTRLTVLETEYKSHLEDLQQEQNRKLRSRDFIIVIVGISLGGIEVARTLGFI
jgi:hypothetical protein